MGHWLSDFKQPSHTSVDRIPLKVWTHVAGIVDPRTGRTSVFINGKSSGESVWPAKSPALPLESPWRIGIAAPKAKEWGWSARGLIDEVVIYARALAPEEIALLAEGVVPPVGDPRKTEPSDAGLVLHLVSDRDVKMENKAVASWSDPSHGIVAKADLPDARPAIGSIDGRPGISFDGKNDQLVIPARPELTFQESDSFTLAIRVFSTARARWQGVIEKSLDAGLWYGLWIDDKNRWVFGSTLNLHGDQILPRVSVVVGVQEGGRERRLYVNGHRVATGPAMNASGSGPLKIGTGGSRPEFFDGQLQEVWIWRRALDPAEIRAMKP